MRSVFFAAAFESQIVQRVHKADAGEFAVFADFFLIGMLYVQVGNVVGENSDFVCVQFLRIFVAQIFFGEKINQFGDKGSGSGGGVENLHMVVPQAAGKMLVDELVGGAHHKSSPLRTACRRLRVGRRRLGCRRGKTPRKPL